MLGDDARRRNRKAEKREKKARKKNHPTTKATPTAVQDDKQALVLRSHKSN
jgi:hypothetical protein